MLNVPITERSNIPERSRIHESRARLPPLLPFKQAEIEETFQPTLQLEPNSESNLRVFDCNICFDVVCEPVVTTCGHLYCWSCLYSWLELINNKPICPVCKAHCSKDKVVPIYGRGREKVDPRSLPKRPMNKDRHVEKHSTLGNVLNILGYQPSTIYEPNMITNSYDVNPAQQNVTGYSDEEFLK